MCPTRIVRGTPLLLQHSSRRKSGPCVAHFALKGLKHAVMIGCISLFLLLHSSSKLAAHLPR